MLIIDQPTVRELLPMGACMDAVAGALEATARGEAVQPLRSITWMPDRRGALGAMPGVLVEPSVLGVKLISFFPGNHGTELDAHQGAVMLFEPDRGRPLALVDASEVTAIRTAAASGVATRLLARGEARRLALVGCGVQARTHLEAMLCARPFEEVRVVGRRRPEAERFAAAASDLHGLPVEAVDDPRDAIAWADVTCTATSSTVPVLEGAWLTAGSHVNAVGACTPGARELDTEAVRRARLFVDSRESALAEPGDILIPLQEQAITEEHVLAEIGELLTGAHPGRGGEGEITLFKSLGLAVEDLAAAHLVYLRAREAGRGVELDLRGPS